MLIGRLAEWCTDPATQIDVKPVIDLTGHIAVDAYEVPDRLAEQATLRDHTCVFPRCTRPARRCDKDHRVAHAQGGATCTCNIAPLCRSHHRLKTHGGWTYTTLEPGTYLWSSPHGYTYQRDHHGTHDLTAPDRSDRSPPDNGCHTHTHPADLDRRINFLTPSLRRWLAWSAHQHRCGRPAGPGVGGAR